MTDGIPQLSKLSDHTARPTSWLMLGRIPYGHVTILGGQPGEGKSTLMMALAAEVTRKRMGVLFVGSEDDPGSDLRPRLIAAGGIDHRFHLLGGGGGQDPVFPDHADVLERAAVETGAGLVFVDPIMAHLAPGINPNDDHSVRQGLRPLARMAQRTRAAVVLVTHLRKSRDGSPLEWFAGSKGLTGISRSALVFGCTKLDAANPADDDRRYLHHVKCNLGHLMPPLSCHIRSAHADQDDEYITTSRLEFGAEEPTARPEELR